MTTAVVFAYHDVGARCLEVLLEVGIAVPLVVTHRDDPAERQWFASVRNLAEAKSIEVLEDPDDALILARVRGLEPDLIFSFYYRRMLPVAILSQARLGAYNMHGSLLPKYRGRAPVNWAVLHGETMTGATLHEMTAKPDAGRLVDQEAVPIGPDDLAIDVYRKIVAAAVMVLRRSAAALAEGRAVLRPQDLRAGSYYGGRRPEDGRIDWSRSAAEIHNLVRAVAPPYPGAFCDGLRVNRARIEADRAAPAKRIGPYREGDAWFAVCGDGRVLRLLEVEEIQ
jgi:methionyl-tRNA formyltransferase